MSIFVTFDSAPFRFDNQTAIRKLEGINQQFTDKRKRRAIPFHLIMTLGIGAKMKVATRLTDIPFAIQSAKTLGSLGYCMWDMDRDLKTGLMDEGSIRKMVGMYEAQEC